jgi:hypothetical protein
MTTTITSSTRIATTEVMDYLVPAARELTLQMLDGKNIAELAEELADEEISDGLPVDQIEAGLWVLIEDKLVPAADKAGVEAAEQASDEDADEWPEQGVVDVEGIVRGAGVVGQAPTYLARRLDRAFREAYASAREG